MKCTCPIDEVISGRRDPMVQWMSMELNYTDLARIMVMKLLIEHFLKTAYC
jgi:hypothetical protein